MRIRTIKPAFWSHPVMSKLDDSVRLAAIGLLNYSDDEGYFLAHPNFIRSALWPLDDDSSKVRRCISELSRIGYISVRNHPDHGEIGRVEKFSDHQRVDRANLSTLKAYFLDERSTNDRRTIDAVREGEGMEGKVKEVPPATEDMTPDPLEIPHTLKTPDFMKAWGIWMNIRRGMKKPKDWVILFRSQLDWLAKYDSATACEIISSSTRNGYQGLFEPKAHANHTLKPTPGNHGAYRPDVDPGLAARLSGPGDNWDDEPPIGPPVG